MIIGSKDYREADGSAIVETAHIIPESTFNENINEHGRKVCVSMCFIDY